jgi:hypothetical protein
VGVALLIGLTVAMWSYALAIGPFRARELPPAHVTAISAVLDAPAPKAAAEAPPPQPTGAEPTPPAPAVPAPKRVQSHKAALAPALQRSNISDFGGRR